nr:MAG TPA: Portal protein [Herelleviridae sp.]
MSRKVRNNNSAREQSTDYDKVIKSIASMSFSELNSLGEAIPTILNSKLQASLASDDVEKAIEAGLYVEKQRIRSTEQNKSIFFLPDSIAYSGRGYKETLSRISFQTLQRMGHLYCVKNVISTRIEQVTRFLKFSNDEQKEGFTIRKKKSLFDSGEEQGKMTKAEKKRVERIVEFLENGGETDKWEMPDSFVTFVRKIMQDSLSIDQLAFEITRTRGQELHQFKAIDGSMIRFLDTVDPNYASQFERYRYKGYLPKYCQVFDQQIVFNKQLGTYVMYYPWELGFGVRNVGTDIWQNGYGRSELESLIEIVTYILNGVQYNGNFFKNGSNPKGFIKMNGPNTNQTQLNDFKQKWRQMLTGTENAHKIPIFAGIDMEWVDLQKGNRDMEFDNWTKFLIVLLCSVYRIDPSELGFQFREAANVFGQDGQKARLDHSRQKGLYPLLIFLQDIINKFIVSELDEEMEFAFTGMEVEDEEKQVKLDADKLSAGMVSMQDMFRKYSGREFDENKDIILNQVYQTQKQMSMYGGEEMNQMVDEQTGEPGAGVPNPFEEVERSMTSNPIFEKACEFIDKSFNDDNEG